MTDVYVTGHRNPDLDAVGAAIGYAELKQRLSDGDRFVAARLGDVNAQTAWALERSGVSEPEFLPHIRLRVRDVMQGCPVTAAEEDPVRRVGLAMAEQGLDMIPVLDGDGTLAGVMTERSLARMYIRESQAASNFSDRPVSVSAIAETLGGELVSGEDREVSGRLWVVSTAVGFLEGIIEEGDIAVIGDRPDAQRRALELGVSLLVASHGIRPTDEVLALAAERGATVIVSPLDSYVSARMVQLSVPCGALMACDPLTVSPEDVLADVTEQILEVDYRAGIVVDAEHRPLGVVSRSDLVNPERRRVLLVDHAERAQSVPGIEEAEIVEILDHHNIGSIETRIPVRATFDPVGSTATLVVERFRREGREPKEPTATVLLAAALSDTVILSSPTTTDRDRRVVAYLEGLLGLSAKAFGREMYEASSDVSNLSASEIVQRDAKEYLVGAGETVCVAQIETVGDTVMQRRDELLEALRELRDLRGYRMAALMVTDIIARDTRLLVAGETAAVSQAFEVDAREDVIDLPGVMSRKKQVAPRVLAAF